MRWEKQVIRTPDVPMLRAHSLCPCSYNREEFIFLADFPKESTIKYMVNSFKGQMAVVTENEEVRYPVFLPQLSLFTSKSSCPVRVNTLQGPQNKGQ